MQSVKKKRKKRGKKERNLLRGLEGREKKSWAEYVLWYVSQIIFASDLLNISFNLMAGHKFFFSVVCRWDTLSQHNGFVL